MNEIKISLVQAETKLETAIEVKLVDSVDKHEVFNCVKDSREEVLGIINRAHKVVEKEILVAEELEIEKRK